VEIEPGKPYLNTKKLDHLAHNWSYDWLKNF